MDTTAPPPTTDIYQLLTVLIANWHVILVVVGAITLIATSVVANARLERIERALLEDRETSRRR